MKAAVWRSELEAVPWLPICVATFWLRAISPISRASAIDFVSGFWQKQALPRFIAVTAAMTWVWSGVLTVTASISFRISSSILRKSE